MTSISHITGVIPALVTPFDAQEEIDEMRLRRLVDHLLNKGVHGLYLTGSTGEGFLMSSDERKQIVEIVMDQTARLVPVVVHIGAIGTRKSIELARHAETLGVDAISSVPPFYWNFDGPSIYRYYRDITESTTLPMIIYNISLAGLIGFEQINRLAEIEGVKGIKYTATTHAEIMQMKEEIGPEFMVYSGADEMALSGFTFGADGIIGSYYNLIPEVFLRLYDAFRAKDLASAREQQRIANTIITHTNKKQYISIIKRALSRLDADAGYCREPFLNYDDKQMEHIMTELDTLHSTQHLTGVEFLEVTLS